RILEGTRERASHHLDQSDSHRQNLAPPLPARLGAYWPTALKPSVAAMPNLTPLTCYVGSVRGIGCTRRRGFTILAPSGTTWPWLVFSTAPSPIKSDWGPIGKCSLVYGSVSRIRRGPPPGEKAVVANEGGPDPKPSCAKSQK